MSPGLTATTGQRLEFAGSFGGTGTNLWQVTNGYLHVRHDLTNTDSAPRMQVTLDGSPTLYGATAVWRTGGAGVYHGSFTLTVTPRYVGSFATNLHVTFRRDSITVTASTNWPEFAVLMTDYTGFGYWAGDLPVECFFEYHAPGGLTLTAIQGDRVYRRTVMHPMVDLAWGRFAYWQLGVQGANSLNASSVMNLERIYAGVAGDASGFSLAPLDVVIDADYTNSAAKGWLTSSVELFPTTDSDAQLTLQVVQHFTGIYTTTNLVVVKAGAGATHASTQTLSVPLQPHARFSFKDTSGPGARVSLVEGGTMLIH
jgi:hypothetical protein